MVAVDVIKAYYCRNDPIMIILHELTKGIEKGVI